MTIALWMAYATLIGACAGATAAALEPFFAARRWPGRWLWALAVGLSLVVPAAVAVRPITASVVRICASVAERFAIRRCSSARGPGGSGPSSASSTRWASPAWAT